MKHKKTVALSISKDFPFVKNKTKISLLEDILNLKVESIIGHGATTMLIDIDKENLLCISIDEKKRTCYEQVGLKTFDCNIQNTGFELFFVERLNTDISDNIDISLLEQAIDIYESTFNMEINSKILNHRKMFFDFDKNLEYYLEMFQFEISPYDRELIQLYLNIIEEACLSVALKYNGQKANLDLHKVQFGLKENGELICFDPFYFI